MEQQKKCEAIANCSLQHIAAWSSRKDLCVAFIVEHEGDCMGKPPTGHTGLTETSIVKKLHAPMACPNPSFFRT